MMELLKKAAAVLTGGNALDALLEAQRQHAKFYEREEQRRQAIAAEFDRQFDSIRERIKSADDEAAAALVALKDNRNFEPGRRLTLAEAVTRVASAKEAQRAAADLRDALEVAQGFRPSTTAVDADARARSVGELLSAIETYEATKSKGAKEPGFTSFWPRNEVEKFAANYISESIAEHRHAEGNRNRPLVVNVGYGGNPVR
jgi:hypothetical protein